MKTKKLKLIALVTALLLIIFIVIFADLLNGNPISKYLAIQSANEHFIKNYSQTDFILHEVEYKIEGLQYYVQISSPSSIDTKFHLAIKKSGIIKRDSYERDVLSKNNTWLRCEQGYIKLVEDVFESANFPYVNSPINSGAIPYYVKDREIDMSILEIDQEFDYKELGKQYGKIIFQTTSDEVTIEKASEILLDITQILNENEVYFHNIYFTIQKSNDIHEEIRLNNFLYSDIYEDGLVKRIQKHLFG